MITTRHYCTYFDCRYLHRALALHQSLKKHGGPFTLWALCFDDQAFQQLVKLAIPEIYPISVDEFLQGDLALIAARANRSQVEFYFTCSPSLPLYVLNKNPDIQEITYLDADLFFFRDPELVFNEIGSASIAIIPHRFQSHLRHLEENGVYNVGWITFKRDEEGLSCLNRWRNQCIEWCFDRVEGSRFADQGYLNEWPTLYKNIKILQHKGINLAPWNVAGYRLSIQDGLLFVEEDPLIFFHFQGLAYIKPGLYKLNFSKYKAAPSRFIKKNLYLPYIQLLEKITTGMSTTRHDSRIRNPDEAQDFIPRIRKIYNFNWLTSNLYLLRELLRGDYFFLD